MVADVVDAQFGSKTLQNCIMIHDNILLLPVAFGTLPGSDHVQQPL